MECIQNNIIEVNRGDTFTSELYLNTGTDLNPVQYILKPGDELYMGVMEPNQPFENAIVKKKFTSANLLPNNNVLIRLGPEETTCLMPGKYFYQIKLKYLNEYDSYDVNTVVEKTQFIIME